MSTLPSAKSTIHAFPEMLATRSAVQQMRSVQLHAVVEQYAAQLLRPALYEAVSRRGATPGHGSDADVLVNGRRSR